MCPAPSLACCLPACHLLTPLCLLLQDWQALPGSVLVTSMRLVGPYGLGSALLLPSGPWGAGGGQVGIGAGSSGEQDGPMPWDVQGAPTSPVLSVPPSPHLCILRSS